MSVSITEKHEFKKTLKEKFGFLFNIHSLFYFVLLLIGVGLAFFGYALLTEHFTTPFSGDYSQQAFAFYFNFYDDWWTFFRTGKFPFFDTNTFIGADNVFANTYYGLFSPFTFPILFFPRSFVPQAMALCTIGKLVCGGLLFRLYLKYMGTTESTARIFSIAYAFTGWMAYYLWFNTFYEVLAFLPLILYGVEKVLKEKKIWAVSLGFFLIGIGNYFFLLTLGIFGVIYACFRFFQTLKTRSAKENWAVLGLGVLGFALGFMLCAIVTFPALFSSFGINRATTGKYLPQLKEALKAHDWTKVFQMVFTYWSPNVANYSYKPTYFYFSYAFPLVSYLYPTVSCRFVNILHYTEFENTGSSIFYFTPLIIMLIPCLWRSIKTKKFSHFIGLGICLVCLFVPFFYFLCGAFANAYGRWEIVVPVVGITYIALNFDHRDEIKPITVLIGGIVAFAAMIGTYFLAKEIIKTYGWQNTQVGTEYVRYNGPYITEFGDVSGVIIYELILVVVETAILTKFWWKKYLPTMVKIFVIVEACVMGNIVANMHSLQSMDTSVLGGLPNFNIESDIVAEINAKDDSFFRLQSTRADESHSNLPSAENYNGISTFHTFYNNEVDDFVHMMNITCHDSSWSGMAFGKHADLDEWLGVKYYMTKDSETTYNVSGGKYVFEPNVPLNYELYIQRDGYRVYKNQYQINFGTSYDTMYYKHVKETNKNYNAFYNGSWLESIRNERILFKGSIMNDADAEEIAAAHSDITLLDEVPNNDMQYVSIRMQGVYANPNSYFNPFNPTRDLVEENRVENPSKSTMNKNLFQIVYTPFYGGNFPCGEKGSYFMFDYPHRQTWGVDYSAAVWLIDTDDKVITFDECRYNSNNSGHIVRGLYSDRPVKYIIVCPLRGNFYSGYPNLYYEPFEDTISRYEKAANENGLKNVKYSVNDFTFDTEYEKERLIVTQVPYTKGWKVVATDESGSKTNLKIYNCQGGFAGFVAPKGKQSYHMSYMTPDLPKWAIVSAVAFLGIGASVAVPLIYKSKKRKEKEASVTLNINE